jgi:Cu(I)/Ag(I) efflux system protein CusF
MKLTLILAAAAMTAAFPAHALQAATDHSAHHPAQAGAAAPQSDGEVRKVDLAQGKITLRHGPLPNLDMPAMTMVFNVPNRKLLEGVKEGDKVKFSADKKDGVFVVTALVAAP